MENKVIKKEYQIEEEFQFGLKKLKCIKGDCSDCAFGAKEINCYSLFPNIGYCSGDLRSDKTDVIFVEMSDEEEKLYSKSEVIALMEKVRLYCKEGWQRESLHRVFMDWDNWLKENLQ